MWCFLVWILFRTEKPFTYIHLCAMWKPGNTWQWLCIESATTTATETYDPTSATGCYVNSITVAMLCSRRTFHFDSNVENSSSTTSKSAPIVSTNRFIANLISPYQQSLSIHYHINYRYVYVSSFHFPYIIYI